MKGIRYDKEVLVMMMILCLNCLVSAPESPSPCHSLKHSPRKCAAPCAGAQDSSEWPRGGLTSIPFLKALRGGKSERFHNKGARVRRGKPWKRAEDYLPELFGESRSGTGLSVSGGNMVEFARKNRRDSTNRLMQAGESTSKKKKKQRAESWYVAKAKKADAKKKKWDLCSKIDDAHDSCEEYKLGLRRISDALDKHMALKDTTHLSRGKHLVKENALKKQLHEQAIEVGFKLETRRRFEEAYVAYSKAFDVSSTGLEMGNAKLAIDRVGLRIVPRKTPQQHQQAKERHVTIEALENKKKMPRGLSDLEALWLSVMLNETILGDAPPQEIDPATLRMPVAKWIAPSLRRACSSSGAHSYSRAAHTSSTIAAYVAHGAKALTYTAGVPRMLMDGRVWAYTHTRNGLNRSSGVVPRFYLPKSNWPLRGPCLFCFSSDHVTKEHAKTGANIKLNKENDSEEEETAEEEQEEGVGVVGLKEVGPDGELQDKEKEKPSAIKTSIEVGAKKEIVEGVGSGGLVVEGGEDEEETEEGSEDSDEKEKRAMLKAYRQASGSKTSRNSYNRHAETRTAHTHQNSQGSNGGREDLRLLKKPQRRGRDRGRRVKEMGGRGGRGVGGVGGRGTKGSSGSLSGKQGSFTSSKSKSSSPLDYMKKTRTYRSAFRKPFQKAKGRTKAAGWGLVKVEGKDQIIRR